MKRRPLTSNFPDYEVVQRFLQILAGTRYSDYVSMMKDIYAHIGSPKSQVNWKNPDEWIQQRLNGESRKLASRLWHKSEQLVNPRHSYDLRAFSGHHALAEFSENVVELTEKGRRFINKDAAIIGTIDEYEGLLFILYEIMEKGPCKRLDLIESFTTFCHTYTTWEAHSSIDSALSARFRHLRQRELIERSGHSYEVTDAGLAYLRQVQNNGKQVRSNLTIAELAKHANDQAREQLGNFLKEMDPYRFEHLVAHLLIKMGYDNVVLTPYAKDKGVDIEADIDFGISSVHEVIQVKRQKNSIGQPIVSQLRGAMPLFDAVRGSIITTGGFSKNAKEIAIVRNAPPISLIDGERLLDLLVEYDIGVRRREIRFFEFDGESLSQFETEDEINIDGIEILSNS